MLREVWDGLGCRWADAESGSHWRRGRRPASGVVDVVPGAPAVALLDEAVRRLTVESRLGPQLFDARPGGGELLFGGGDIPFGVGRLWSRVEGPAGRTEAGKPALLLSAGVSQVVSGAVVGRQCDVGGGGHPGVFGVGRFGVAAGAAVEGGL
jgi:hypothetical protein